MTIVAFAASVHQDQAAQNVQPDIDQHSALEKLSGQKQQWKSNHFGHISRVEVCDRFIGLLGLTYYQITKLKTDLSGNK